MATKAEQLAALQKQMEELKNAPDDEDFDVMIYNENGQSVSMPYSKGRSILQRFGLDIDDLPKQDPAGDGDGSDGDPSDGDGSDGGDGGDGKPRGRGYFQGKK